MSTIECIGRTLVILVDKRVRYVKKVKNHWPSQSKWKWWWWYCRKVKQ